MYRFNYRQLCTTLIISVIMSLLVGMPALAQQDEDANQGAGLSYEVISAYPEPNITQLYANDNLVNDRIYRRVEGSMQIHDAPNGNITGAIDAGFNFITVYSTQGDWVEISQGRWVHQSSFNNEVALSNFGGILLPEDGLPYTVAWILVNTFPSSEPGGEPNEANPLQFRYTTVNIYDSVEIDGWEWFQIGVDQWVHQTLVARVLPVERFEEVDSERWVSVDLYEQVVIAYEGNTPIFATLISSGLSAWSTNEGLFNIYVRYERTVMSGANGQPDFYYLEEVPWTMYFDQDIALHGAYWHDGFGYRRSHGCVNMSITDAHWLYQFTAPEFDFTVDNDLGAAVYVYSSGDYR